MGANFSELLKQMETMGASDIHLKTGAVPIYRVNGQLVPIKHPPLTKEEVAAIVEKIVPNKLQEFLKRDGSVDFAFSIDPTTRFRSNAFYQRGTLSLSLRRLQYEHLSFDDLTLPPDLSKISEYRRGMILITGPTGTGKSTTMAAIVDYINSTRKEHILTIEDPIEFLHKDKMSLIEQREIGIDARSFDQSLRHTLRQDPDVILIGEMRDRETITIAIRAAMTGHLVISTLHTINAVQTVNRIINYFPTDEQHLLRSDLGIALKAVISQRLVPATDNQGRVPCAEVMIVNDIVRKLMREDRIDDMVQVIKNRGEGMQTFDQSLVDLHNKKLINLETGMLYAEDVPGFKRIVGGAYAGDDRSRIIGGF